MTEFGAKDKLSQQFIDASERLYREFIPQCDCMKDRYDGDLLLHFFGESNKNFIAYFVGQIGTICDPMVKVLLARHIGQFVTDVEAVLRYRHMPTTGAVKYVPVENRQGVRDLLDEIFKETLRQIELGEKQLDSATPEDHKYLAELAADSDPMAVASTAGPVVGKPN